MHRPDLHPTHEEFTAADFVASCGWTPACRDADRLVSAAEVGAELARWCQTSATGVQRRALSDRARLAQVLTAMRATALASSRLLELLADDVDPHAADLPFPARMSEAGVFRHAPGEEVEMRTELAEMGAAENLRDAALLAAGLTHSIARAVDHLHRSTP